MNLAIEFNPAAFKHGVSEADIRLVFDTAKYDGFLDEDDPDAEDRLRVFHAMKCRSAFIRLLERRKNERFDR